MSRAKKGTGATKPRTWRQLVPYRLVQSDDLKVQETLEKTGTREIWQNDRYMVFVDRHPENGYVTCLGIKRHDKAPIRDWRHFQWIKNQIAGKHAWGLEVFPDEDFIVDTANHYWIWILPPGIVPPFGFHEGRRVSGAEEAAKQGARQREPEGDGTDGS